MEVGDVVIVFISHRVEKLVSNGGDNLIKY